MSLLLLIEHGLLTLFIAAVVRRTAAQGVRGLLALIFNLLMEVPGFERLLQLLLVSEVTSFVAKVKDEDVRGTAGDRDPAAANKPKFSLPAKGISAEELRKELADIRHKAETKAAGMFAYVYTSDNEHFNLQREAHKLFDEKSALDSEVHENLIQEFHSAFMHENALNPMAFPALRQFENEVVSMTAAMLNGDSHVTGSLTSGGTESVLMAMKTYRDRAKHHLPHITQPEMVAPITIHPAHEKAAHYFGFKIVHVPVNENYEIDVQEYEKAITKNTVALLCSAPQYCHGIIDPIERLSELAVRRKLPLHVDACFGGFMLPWLEKLGYPIPLFDFRLPGVTSMSADIHKYGFGAKGASVVLYRNSALRKFQYFAYSHWPGGLFASPSMAGSRPGGNIASAWVALKAMGENGYMNTAKTVMQTTQKLIKNIEKVKGLKIVGKPCMTAFAVMSSEPGLNIMAVADVMETKGFKMERQQLPDSIHFSIIPSHAGCEDKLGDAFKESVQQVRANPSLAKKGTAAVYGMTAKIPSKSVVDSFLLEFFSEMYTP